MNNFGNNDAMSQVQPQLGAINSETDSDNEDNEQTLEEPKQEDSIVKDVNSKQTVNKFHDYLKWYLKHKVIDTPAPEPVVVEKVNEKVEIFDKVVSHGQGKSRFIGRESIDREMKEKVVEAV